MMETKENNSGARLLTLKQAADSFAISKRSLERRIACGEFPRPLKIGRSSRVSVQDVEDYLKRLQKERSEGGGPS